MVSWCGVRSSEKVFEQRTRVLKLNLEMAYFEKGRKEDLRLVAVELGVEVNESMRIIDLRELITKSVNYEGEFVREILLSVLNERIKREEAEEKYRIEKERSEESN